MSDMLNFRTGVKCQRILLCVILNLMPELNSCPPDYQMLVHTGLLSYDR